MKFYWKWHDKVITDYINSLENPVIDVTEQTKKRSLAQNRLFHANIGLIAKEMWEHEDYVKVMIKDSITTSWALEMTYIVKNKKTGNEITKERSTTDLDTKEFSKLMDYVFDLWERYLKLKMIYPSDIGIDSKIYESGLVHMAREVFGN